VAQPLAVQTLADAVVGQDVDRAVLDDAGPDPREDVVLRAILNDDRVDAVLREDLGQNGPLSGFRPTEAAQRAIRRVMQAAATWSAGTNLTRSLRTVRVTSANDATTSSLGPSTGTAREQVP
jgi:hypothetical protein